MKLKLSDIRKLKNKDKLPVVIGGGCNICQFDVSILKFFNINALIKGQVAKKQLGESLINSKKGGVVAVIGYTGVCHGAIGDAHIPSLEIQFSLPDGTNYGVQYLAGWLETNFFKNYNSSDSKVLGMIHCQAITNYQKNFPIN